jgi:hypothetical protein
LGTLADIPALFLEEDQRVDGRQLVEKIRGLDHRPLLVVLASCQSAGGVGLAGLGPRLAEAGVAAVIAMQGDVFMKTSGLHQSINRFFRELLRDGQIDRAMCVARAEICTNLDYWMPVLFMRRRSGSIWYEPGFGEGMPTSDDKSIVDNLTVNAGGKEVSQGMCSST